MKARIVVLCAVITVVVSSLTIVTPSSAESNEQWTYVDTSITNATLSNNTNNSNNGFDGLGCGGAICDYGYEYGGQSLVMEGNKITKNSSAGNYGSFSWGGLYYGYTERSQIRYEFGGKTGFYGLISLEDPADENSYMPNVVGRVGYGAAWGDPAIVLTCGVGVPAEFDEFSACTEASGVGWFVPPEQEDDQGSDVLLTAVSYSPRVSLFVPADRRGAPSADALATLADPVREHLTLVDECT